MLSSLLGQFQSLTKKMVQFNASALRLPAGDWPPHNVRAEAQSHRRRSPEVFSLEFQCPDPHRAVSNVLVRSSAIGFGRSLSRIVRVSDNQLLQIKLLNLAIRAFLGKCGVDDIRNAKQKSSVPRRTGIS